MKNNGTEEPDEFLKTPEVCNTLRISPRTLHELRATGKIPFVRLTSKTIRYRRSAIREYLARIEQGVV